MVARRQFRRIHQHRTVRWGHVRGRRDTKSRDRAELHYRGGARRGEGVAFESRPLYHPRGDGTGRTERDSRCLSRLLLAIDSIGFLVGGVL